MPVASQERRSKRIVQRAWGTLRKQTSSRRRDLTPPPGTLCPSASGRGSQRTPARSLPYGSHAKLTARLRPALSRPRSLTPLRRAGAGAPPLAQPCLAARKCARTGDMVAAGDLLGVLLRLCRVLLFLSQFYILSGGGELKAGDHAGSG